MVKKLIKSSAYLSALVLAAVLSLFAGNKGSSDYTLSNESSGGIPVAHADVPHTGDIPDLGGGDSGGGDGGCGSDSGDGGCSP